MRSSSRIAIRTRSITACATCSTTANCATQSSATAAAMFARSQLVRWSMIWRQSMNQRYAIPEIDVAAEVRERLPRDGYVHIDRALPEETFTAAARQLGTITMRTDIRVDAAA